jgi:hypothetical protein
MTDKLLDVIKSTVRKKLDYTQKLLQEIYDFLSKEDEDVS